MHDCCMLRHVSLVLLPAAVHCRGLQAASTPSFCTKASALPGLVLKPSLTKAQPPAAAAAPLAPAACSSNNSSSSMGSHFDSTWRAALHRSAPLTGLRRHLAASLHCSQPHKGHAGSVSSPIVALPDPPPASADPEQGGGERLSSWYSNRARWNFDRARWCTLVWLVQCCIGMFEAPLA